MSTNKASYAAVAAAAVDADSHVVDAPPPYNADPSSVPDTSSSSTAAAATNPVPQVFYTPPSGGPAPNTAFNGAIRREPSPPSPRTVPANSSRPVPTSSTHLLPPGAVEAGTVYYVQHHHHRQQRDQDWTPPSSPSVASARARRRFFVALFWAIVIYVLVGLLIGGGIHDIRNSIRHHKLPKTRLPIHTNATVGIPEHGHNGSSVGGGNGLPDIKIPDIKIPEWDQDKFDKLHDIVSNFVNRIFGTVVDFVKHIFGIVQDHVPTTIVPPSSLLPDFGAAQ